MNKAFRTISYIIFILGFVWVSAQLFLENQTEQVMVSIFSEDMESLSTFESLKIIYPDDALNFEPTSLNPSTRQRLLNVYEPLVKTDRDLNFEPGLALSWGVIDDLTWEFSLRPDVKFHDGSDFDVDDVKASILRAKNYDGSELVNFANSIDGIEELDDLTFRLYTKRPNPLLLLGLSTVLMVPEEQMLEDFPYGTASYEIVAWDQGDMMKLKRFNDYWGNKAQFSDVELQVITNKSERVHSFLRGEADLLAFVPFDAVDAIEEEGFETASIPSLEVQFLLFNIDSNIFKNLKRRQSVSMAIDQKSMVEAVGGYARPVNQFVSNGVFGFNPDIKPHIYDIERARNLAPKLEGKTVQVHLPIGLDILGEHIRKQLMKIGVKVVVSYLDMTKLIESFDEGKADIYFLGYRTGTGDSGEFLKDVVESSADFNIANYSNEIVDQLIVDSEEEMDPMARLEILQTVMQQLDKDFFGVPLFEYETLYAFSEKLMIEPRIDGLIYFDELIKR